MAGNFEKEFRDTFEEPLREIKSAGEEIRRGFGQVDEQPSPPMRPEKAELPSGPSGGTGRPDEVQNDPHGDSTGPVAGTEEEGS